MLALFSWTDCLKYAISDSVPKISRRYLSVWTILQITSDATRLMTDLSKKVWVDYRVFKNPLSHSFDYAGLIRRDRKGNFAGVLLPAP